MPDQGTEEPTEYDRYDISVPGTWSKVPVSRTVTVYGTRAGQIPEVVARGTATLRHMGGEPTGVIVAGFRARGDWDKLNTGMGPGEWVCTAVRAN